MKPTVSSELTFLNMLQILFIAFKLAGIITWSWWLVMAPYLFVVVIGFLSFAANGVNRNAISYRR